MGTRLAWLAAGVAAALAVCASGCVLAGSRLWPETKVVQMVQQTSSVRVESHPRGARVSVDGRARGVTPLDLKTSYRLKRSYRKRSVWGVLVGATLSLVVSAYAALQVGTLSNGEPDLLDPWFFLGLISAVDGTAGAMAVGFYGVIENANRAANPRLDFELRRINVNIAWQGRDAIRVPIRVPGHIFVSVNRNPHSTFDEALIHWQRTSRVRATGEGLYNIATAYARLGARTNHRAHLNTALDYFARYLKTDALSVARRVAVEKKMRSLRAGSVAR